MRLRYVDDDDVEPPALRPAFVKTKGVEKTTTRHQERVLDLEWRGLCKDLSQLEAVAEKSGTPAIVISHAAVACTIKAGKNASADKLKKELGAVEGVLHMTGASGTLTLHADLEKLDDAKLRKAAAAAGYEIVVKSHVRIEVAVTEGEPERVARGLVAVKGVLTSVGGEVGVSLWATKAVTDEALKSAASRMKDVALGTIERK